MSNARVLEDVRVSVVVTVKNEVDSVVDLLSSLKSQVHKPSEIIVVDGGSNDGTIEKLRRLRGIRLFSLPSSNRSTARNFGIANSRFDLIAITDAGCVADKSWLREMVRSYIGTSSDVVAGFYRSSATSPFQKCLAPYVLVMPDNVRAANFLPATRSMMLKKRVWKESGGFPEEYSYNEDYVFARRLRRNGFKIVFCPEAKVLWKPRSDFFQAASMFYFFAYGDAEAGIYRSKVILIFSRYTMGMMLIIEKLPINLLVVVLSAYLLWSVGKNYRYVRSVQAFYYLPLLQISSDIIVMVGTFVGTMSKLMKLFIW